MPVASLAELREALRAASPGDTVELAPGEYQGPVVIDMPITLRGQDRRTVLWRRSGPVIDIRAPGVTLDKLHLERTVHAQGPLVVHRAGCVPTGKESTLMESDALISLGELIPGSTLILPLELTTTARAEIAVTGLYGAQIAPAVLESPGSHLVWLTMDGKAVVRGEVLLGEITLREGDKTRHVWLSGSALETVPTSGPLCLAAKKTRLHPSASGFMLDATKLAAIDSAKADNGKTGRYAFVQCDPTGVLFLHVPGEPPMPVEVNGVTLPRWSRLMLHEKDTIKVGGVALSVQPAEPLSFTIEPNPITFDDFDNQFPEAVALTLNNGKTAWKGHALSTVPWLDVVPAGDFRIPPMRGHTWAVQLNANALTLPNGPHEAVGGVLVIGSNHLISLDAKINIRRPDTLLRVSSLDVGEIEWNWPVERELTLPVGNLGRGTWAGTVQANVPWLEVVTPMPMTVGPWAEEELRVKLMPDWERLSVGTHDIPDALLIMTEHVDQPGQPVAAQVQVIPGQGHITVADPVVLFDEVERNAPLPDLTFQVRNEGGGTWSGTARALNGWVRVKPTELTVEPGASADMEVDLLDIPPELTLDTLYLIDEIRLDGPNADITVSVQLTVVERPPYLVASPVTFPPFVRGDTPPETTLRIYNNGPAKWRGSVVANYPWLNTPAGLFVCEPGDSIPITITLNNQALDALQNGFSSWDNALSVTGGREPVTVSVQVDVREAISELYLDTPTLNFGQVDGAVTDLPSLNVRLINAGPMAWTGKVELCAPWLSFQSPVRAFDLNVPGISVIEFAVRLNEQARLLPPGITTADEAIAIKGSDQQLAVRALLILNEWSPLLTVTPRQITLTDDQPQTIMARNTGSRSWSLQVSAVAWLTAEPVEFTLEAGQEQAITVQRAIGPTPSIVSDPRAVVIIGSGRETEVEVTLAESAVVPEP